MFQKWTTRLWMIFILRMVEYIQGTNRSFFTNELNMSTFHSSFEF